MPDLAHRSEGCVRLATSIWGSLIKSGVPIAIEACWTPLDPEVFGGAWPSGYERNVPGAPLQWTWYPRALANALHGSDLDTTRVDIEAVFASGFPWYFGTSGTPGPGQLDFVTAVLRELGYGLGYESSMWVESGSGNWGYPGDKDLTVSPYVYDRLVVNGSGQSLIGGFPSPSSALAAQLQSNNVYFDGAQAKAANNGSRPKLFAPSTWNWGWSISYLDPVYDGTANALMTYTLAPQEVVHDPGPMGLAILNDLGWVSAPTVTGFRPASGNIGASVAISGTNLTGTTSVTFNGISASLSNFSAAEIVATVPADATTGPVTVTTPGGTATSATSFTITDAVPPQVTLLPQPVRIADTRSGSGFQRAGQSLTGYTSYKRFTLAGQGGIPANATAVLVNLTAVGYRADGWLSAYPACTTKPATSNVNFDTVENAIANFAIVKLGTGSGCQGMIDVTGANGTNVIVDAVGYLVATTSDQVALLDSPQRFVDTRSGSGFQGEGGPLLGHSSPRRFTLAGQGAIPADATAVLVNLTAVGYNRDGWLAAYPACTAMPATSNLNYDTVENAIANFAVVKLGADSASCQGQGKIDVIGDVGTNVIVDVAGYLVATPNDQIVLLDSPQRIVDTRSSSGFQGAGAPLQNTSSPKSYQLAERGGVPAYAKGVITNVTAVGYTRDGWVAAYPTGGSVPATSSVNFDTQENAIANTAIVRLGTGGKVNLVASAPTNAIIDVTGYLR